MTVADPAFDGVLFFPVTPFTDRGDVDLDVLAEHVESRLPFGPGGVFPACGTGEFHALSEREAVDVLRATVQAVGGRVPVIAGTGGPPGHAMQPAGAAAESGADGLLLLPPSLVAGTTDGLAAWVEAVAAASELPGIVSHRGTARYTPGAITRLAANPRLIGF